MAPDCVDYCRSHESLVRRQRKKKVIRLIALERIKQSKQEAKVSKDTRGV